MAKQGGKRMRFHLPYTALPPPLVSESAGIARLVARPSRSRLVGATILDTPDNRLLRAGVVVAHRLVDGLGDWYLSAPGWAPHLPTELTLPLISGEPPEDIARLIRPLARGALIGPVAALESERQEYDLVGSNAKLLAAIRDEKVTVRRDGVATARYREATVSPSSELTPQQREFLVATMNSVSATPVSAFPTLQQRLGPPATGLTDLPAAPSVGRDATMEELVCSVFATDLRSLTFELLSLASGDGDGLAALNAQLDSTRRDLRGLAHVLDAEWCEAVEGELVGLPYEHRSAAVSHAISVCDALVGGFRVPKLGDAAQQRAASLLFKRAERALFSLADRCRVLDEASIDDQWRAALVAADELSETAAVGARLLGRRVRRRLTLLDAVAAELADCGAVEEQLELEALSVEEAFALGAATERRRVAVQTSRAAFVAAWPDRIRRLRKLLEKSRKHA